ncbi:MFS transporter [Xanthobacteraceae bacterium A53D]
MNTRSLSSDLPYQPDTAPQGIEQRIDRLPVTRLHLAIIAICTAGLFADIAEVALSNALSAVFLAPPHSMARDDLALLLASVFAGGAVGAPLFGACGDRYGRRVALQLALVVITAGSLAAAASPDLTSLTISRFLSGLGIGGYPALSAAYLTDLMPPRQRGRLMMLSAGLGCLGAPAILLLIGALTPVQPLGIEAWRWAIGAGALLAGISALLFALLPESPRWLASVGRHAEADAACRRLERAAGLASPMASSTASRPAARAGIAALLATPAARWRTLLVASLFALSSWATVGFPLLSAAVLLKKGFSLNQSLLFVTLAMLGPAIGSFAMALVVDHVGRRTSLAAATLGMAAAGLLFAWSNNLTVLTLCGIAFTTSSAIYVGLLSLYATELVPTQVRASSLTLGWTAGRITSICAPLVLLPLLTGQGPSAMFAVVTAALAASLLLILLGPGGLAGKPVE